MRLRVCAALHAAGEEKWGPLNAIDRSKGPCWGTENELRLEPSSNQPIHSSMTSFLEADRLSKQLGQPAVSKHQSHKRIRSLLRKRHNYDGLSIKFSSLLFTALGENWHFSCKILRKLQCTAHPASCDSQSKSSKLNKML